MSALTDAIARLESGGSNINGPSGGYANYRYQQFPGFVSQYGFGETGINNYASQVLAANPNATFGDLYGGYVTGTGNPASASMDSLLTTTQPGAQGAYSNLVNNSPISPSTPLSSLIGSDNVGNGIWNSGTSGVPYSGYDNGLGSDSGSGVGIGGLGDTSGMSGYNYTGGNYQSPDYYQSTPDGGGQGYNIGDNNPSVGSTVAYGLDNNFTNGNFAGGSTDAGGGYTPGTDAGGNIDVSGGSMPELSTGYPYNAPLNQAFGGVLNGFTGLLSGNSSNSGGSDFFAWLGDWAMRGAVIILGFIFIIGGLVMLKGGSVLLAPEKLIA